MEFQDTEGVSLTSARIDGVDIIPTGGGNTFTLIPQTLTCTICNIEVEARFITGTGTDGKYTHDFILDTIIPEITSFSHLYYENL